MTMSVQCPCLSDQPQGIRPGPNAPTRLEADPRCKSCNGEGDLRVNVSYDPPPIPVRGSDWNAVVDGREEYGPVGYGATKMAAVQNLLDQLED